MAKRQTVLGKCLKIAILSFSTSKIVAVLLFYSSFYRTIRQTTGYACSKRYKSDRVDRVLEEDETAQMASDIADQRCAEGDHADGQDEGPVASVEPCVVSLV